MFVGPGRAMNSQKYFGCLTAITDAFEVVVGVVQCDDARLWSLHKILGKSISHSFGALSLQMQKVVMK